MFADSQRHRFISTPLFLVLLLGAIGVTCLFSAATLLFATENTRISTPLLSPVVTQKQVQSPMDHPLKHFIDTHRSTDSYPPNTHFPTILSPSSSLDEDISADAYAVMDVNTHTLLLAKNVTREFPIASVTKVMTVLIALDHAPLNLEVTVSSAAASIGEASMGSTAGERYTLHDLLYGALLPSGNDAAEAIAEAVGKYVKGIDQRETDGGGAKQWFVDAMNRKAQDLGMYDTYFYNPSGLDEETAASSNFSTPLDLLALGTYAMTNFTFADIVNTRYHHIPYQADYHKELYVQNILQLSDSYPGIVGIKPGVSIFAKETLLSYFKDANREMVAVVLGSWRTKDDVVTLYKSILGS